MNTDQKRPNLNCLKPNRFPLEDESQPEPGPLNLCPSVFICGFGVIAACQET